MARRTTTLLALGQLVTWGALYYAFAVLLPLMRADLGWSPALLSAAFSLGLLVSGLLAPSVGRHIDRSGSRRTMTLGSVGGAAGLALWALATHPLAYLAAWVVIGAAMAATLYEPAFATIVREHPGHRRGALLAITLVGALASPVFTPLTAWSADRVGWRTALFGLAAVVLAAAALHARLPAARRAPETPETPGTREQSPPPGDRKRPSMRDRGGVHAHTRQLGLGIATAAGVAAAVNAHLVAVLLEAGHGMEVVTGLVAGLGVAKIAGRLLVAALPERHDPRRVIAIVLVLQAAGLAAAVGPYPLVLALPILFGGATGAMTLLKPLALASLGDTGSFARRSGRIHRTTTIANSAAPLLLGAGATWFAAYSPVWWALPAVLVSVAALVARRPARPGADRDAAGGHTTTGRRDAATGEKQS